MLIAKKYRRGYIKLIKNVHSTKWHPFRARFLTFERWLIYRARVGFIFKKKISHINKIA